MRVDLIVDKSRLEKDMFSRIEPEMNKRILPFYPDARIRVRKGENNHLDISGKDKNAKTKINELLEAMFDEADEWLHN